MSARWLSPLAALGACLLASAAVAQNATSPALEAAVQVEPEGDACLSEAVVRARVQKRLARDARLSDVQVVVHLADAPRLEVSRGGQRIAERLFESFPTRCNARRDAIAVAVALALERAHEAPGPATAATSPDDAPSTSTTSGAESSPETQPASTATPSPTSPEPASQPAEVSGPAPEASSAGENGGLELALGVHAGLAAAFQILPSVAFAGVAGADLGFSRYRLTFSLSVLASLAERDEVLGGAIESQLLLGRLLAVHAMDLGGIALEGGLGLLAGGVFARGDYATDRSTQLAYVAPLARLALRFPARNTVMARLALDVMLAALRPAYAVREAASGARDAEKPGVVGLALSFELAFDLL